MIISNLVENNSTRDKNVVGARILMRAMDVCDRKQSNDKNLSRKIKY